MDASLNEPCKTRVAFNGQGFEYFKIWFVNVALTILTLGIYSAWAKVRNKKYFYGSTRILNQSFEYHATGWQILKGRLLALAVLVLVNLASIIPLVGLVLYLAFLALLPWFINAGLGFNAKVSSWRNVRFRFTGNWPGAFMAFIIWPILAVFSAGLLMPLAVKNMHRYLVTNHSYGEQAFEFSAETSVYYRGLFGWLIVLIVVCLGIVAIGMATNAIWIAMTIAYAVLYLFLFSLKPLLFNLYWQHLSLKGNRFVARMPIGRYVWIYLSNSFLVALSFGLLFPWSKVRMARFTAESLKVLDVGNVNSIVAKEVERTSAIGEELGEAFDVDVGFGV